jgi:hypothetical protein
VANYEIGFVYVLTNKAMPGLVKIGKTAALTAGDRAKKIYTTGVPRPFDVAFRALTSEYEAVESLAHNMLDLYRETRGREFFRVTPEQAINVVREAMLEAAGIDVWQQPDPHYVKHKDRIALPLRLHDLLVVIAYPTIFSSSAQVADIWQAHATGDVLEIFGTNSPGHVAGFATHDVGGTSDPVPYLEHASTAPNGLINGRERLVPGTRLLWLSPSAQTANCPSVLFEAREYCQAVCRTWTPVTDSGGLPVPMNEILYKPVPPPVETAINTAIRLALKLPVPRTWAPQYPDEQEWASIGHDPQPAQYWIPQLQSPPRRRRKK